ncbi:MAG: hypothetical protein GYA17_18545 [Chloroflexi bacterium]|nr:hypothetical protein [Chloroflexota bacterium]
MRESLRAHVRHSLSRAGRVCLAAAVLLAGCSPAPGPSPSPVAATTSTPAAGPLEVVFLYPTPDTEVEMGQTIRVIAQVKDARGEPVTDAGLTFGVADPGGQPLVALPATVDAQGTYRSERWTLPHHQQAGLWRLTAEAQAGPSAGRGVGSFPVRNSTSETLLQRYGFWLEAPSLRGIVPTITAERGDAQDGLVRWGGSLPAQHILPTVSVEIYWRQGNFHLDSPEAVRRFMLEDLGQLGFTPVRALGPFEPARFQHWDAWRVGGRGQVKQDQVEWMVFYAPEVDKTYSLGTLVVQPPQGIDPHAALRDSFQVDATVQAQGVAPEPLPQLLPGPELLAPPLGERFTGTAQPILLEWAPLKAALAADEYYEVAVDYNLVEANTVVRYATRETSFRLPLDLYETPNCEVFNWRVTLKRQTGVDARGEPVGEALSYASLYAYVQWLHPLDDPQPFVHCPNEQF